MLSHISFTTLPAVDPDRALDFHVRRLRMTVTADARLGDQRWIVLAIPGAAPLLRLEHVAQMPEGPRPDTSPDRPRRGGGRRKPARRGRGDRQRAEARGMGRQRDLRPWG